jgi:6-phospho-3-hexuloisomerase
MVSNKLQFSQILHELDDVVSGIDAESVSQFIAALMKAERIFVAGAGRSGLMVRAFAMRLMHLGLKVHVVGETTTPSIAENDLLVIASGSGETGMMVQFARAAKKNGAQLALITIYADSTIGQMADTVVQINAPTSKKEDKASAVSSVQPMGSLFEQSLLLVLDAVILELMNEIPRNIQNMIEMHANLE